MLTNAEGTAETTASTAIKRETTGETKVNEKEREPHEMTNRATEKRLPYADKEGREDEMSSRIAPIYQENQAEEAASGDNNICRNNEQSKKITDYGNGKWCAKKKSTIRKTQWCKKDSYDDIINKYK